MTVAHARPISSETEPLRVMGVLQPVPFFTPLPLVQWERRCRIRLTIAAFAYEYGYPLTMTDAEFDALAAQSNPKLRTGRLDDWWRKNFEPHTGQWIASHPELDRVETVYKAVFLRE